MAIQDEIPRSRLTLTYRTTIDGALEDITLPLRILVLADFSQGTSKDRRLDLGDRPLRSIAGRNLKPLMNDMNMSLSCTVPNRIDPENSDTMDVSIPITSMDSFSPDQIMQNVPKLRAMLLLRQLLLEMLTNIENRKDIKKAVQELYGKPQLMDALLAKLRAFEGMRMPSPKPAAKQLPQKAPAAEPQKPAGGGGGKGGGKPPAAT